MDGKLIKKTLKTTDSAYEIEWKVLDSTTEGPLEWVKIGIPNANVDSFKALSKNISKIAYTSLGGDYIRIDFDRQYKEGEVINFSFKFHQTHMYTITSTGLAYNFTAGWFDDIVVKESRRGNGSLVFDNAEKRISEPQIITSMYKKRSLFVHLVILSELSFFHK